MSDTIELTLQVANEVQARAFAALPEKTRRDRYGLLDKAVDDLIDKYGLKGVPPAGTPGRKR